MVMVLAGRTISMTAISISTARVGEGRETETKKPYYGCEDTYHRQNTSVIYIIISRIQRFLTDMEEFL